MNSLLSFVRRIVVLLDPKSSAGEPFKAKDGSLLVGRASVEIEPGIVISGFGIWAQKGQITVSAPSDGFRQPIILAGKITTLRDDDGGIAKIGVQKNPDQSVWEDWTEVIRDAYGDIRSNPDLRGIWTPAAQI